MQQAEVEAAEVAAAQSYAESKAADMADSDKLQLLIAALAEDKTNKLDNGEVKTSPAIVDGVIVWLPTAERAGAGTLTEPRQYVQGDTVTAGVYYCVYKIGASGRAYAQLTQGTYKAVTDGTPSKFGAITHFELVH